MRDSLRRRTGREVRYGDRDDGPVSGVGDVLARVQQRVADADRRDAAAVFAALVGGWLVLRGVHDHVHGFVAAGIAVLLVARAALLGRPLSSGHVAAALPLLGLSVVADSTGHLFLAWTAVVAAGLVAGLPRAAPPPAPPSERRHAWALVQRTPGDPLAPFALRTDKAYVFTPDRSAAVAYRVRFGTAVASGDPVGDPAAASDAVEAFLAHADANGWRSAAIGVSDRSLATWRGAGWRAVPIGRDVVVDVGDFALQGRAFRNLRQAVRRTHNAGVSTEIVAERDLSGEQRAGLEQVIRAGGKTGQTRGFAMILDHVLDGTHPGVLIAMARDRHGRVVAFQRYATADEGRELSLDVPWRVPGAPNGVDERLIADMVAWARARGGARLSVAFAPFPELFSVTDRGLLQTVAYRGVRLLDRFIKLESLYRFVRKFHAFGGQRYVLLRPVQVGWVALAALTLEFGTSRRPWRRGGAVFGAEPVSDGASDRGVP